MNVVKTFKVSALAALISMGFASASMAQLMSLPEAIEYEKKDLMPDNGFWNAPTGSPGVAGQLIRSEQVDSYNVPKGSTATRILYWSTDLYQNPTVASAVLIKPAGKAPAGGWPLAVWAHGTTGVGKQCGASNSHEAGYNVQPLLGQGFAVLAVDYAGLATDGGHKYLNKIVNATDTINAVPAAHKAVTGITDKWIAIGHSQGGLAAWGVAEQMATRQDSSYIGSVALAPAVGGTELIAKTGNQPGAMFYPVYVARAIKEQYPNFDINSMLTPEAARHYDDLVNKGCYLFADSTLGDFKPGSVLKAGWEKAPYVSDFFAISKVGDKPIKGPMLVAVGTEDTATPLPVIEPDVKAVCSIGQQVEFRKFPGEHSPMLETSLKDVSAWMKDRFAGKKIESYCEGVASN